MPQSHWTVPGDQISRQGQFGLRPAGQVGPAGPDTGIVPPDPLLGLAVDLDVGGVQVDRRVAQHQRGPHLRRNRTQPTRVKLGQGGLDPGQLRRSEPARQPGRGPARCHRRLGQQSAAGISADPIHPVQAVLPRKLRGRHPHQQLPAVQAPVARLNRPNATVEHLHDAQPVDELIDRDESREPGQGLVRGTHTDTSCATLCRTQIPS